MSNGTTNGTHATERRDPTGTVYTLLSLIERAARESRETSCLSSVAASSAARPQLAIAGGPPPVEQAQMIQQSRELAMLSRAHVEDLRKFASQLFRIIDGESGKIDG